MTILLTHAVAGGGGAGSWSNGNVVTFTGSGFGTKSSAAPVVFDNCSGSNIKTLWDDGWPNTAGAPYDLAYNTAINGIGMPTPFGTKYMTGCHVNINTATGGNNVMCWKARTLGAFPQYSLRSWYQRFDDNWDFSLGSPNDGNLKVSDYSNGTSPYDLPNNWYNEYNSRPTSNTSSCNWHPNDDDSNMQNPDENGHNFFWGAAVNPMAGAWAKIEEFIYLDNTNNGSGYLKCYENGSLVINYAGSTDKMAGTSRTDAIGGYARAQGGVHQYRYYKDLYLDYTLQCVILHNNSTLGSSTIREYQPAGAWSNTSITVTVNQGNITSGTRWVSVLDTAGAVAVVFSVTVP